MTDNALPDGPWSGFYVYAADGRRHFMSLRLTFREGVVSGAGDDDVGFFSIRGRYDSETLEIHWTKAYLGRHSVYYRGFGDPARIWGTWELPGLSGGFKIWPGDGDEAIQHAAETAVEKLDWIGIPTPTHP